MITTAHEAAAGGQLLLKTDVCVVGTGAGGAALGNVVARSGARMIWLEEGWAWQPEQFIPKPSVAYRNLFQENNTRVIEGNAFIPMPGGRGVGGTTLINSAICLRAPEHVRKAWAALGIPWMAPHSELDGIYDEISRKIQVTKMSPEQVRGNSMIFKKGADALQLGGDFVSRNAPGCVGCGVCQLGCPSAGKGSVDRNLIPEAIDAGAALYAGARVERVLVENGRCRGVEGIILKPGVPGAIGRFRVEADRTVVSGSAVGTPMLLHRSGRIANRSGQVGENLHIHPCTGTISIFNEDIKAWSGAAQGYYVDVPEDDFIVETATATPELLFTLAQRILRGDLKKMNRMALCGVVVRDRSKGSVRPAPDGTAKLTYHVLDEDRERLIKGLRVICRVYAAAGAVEIHCGLNGHQPVSRVEDALAALSLDRPLDELTLYATHAQGTCRMGPNPDHDVVRPDGRTHDIEGLYIADGSLFPEAIGVNPQLTIMAMATYIGQQMVKRG